MTGTDLDDPADPDARSDAPSAPAPSAPAPSDPNPGAATGRRPAVVLGLTLMALLALAAVTLGALVLLGVVHLQIDDADDGASELRRAAGQFAEALVTYDHRDPDAHRDRVLSFATGSFREEYEDAFDQGLAQIITEVEAVSQGFVKDVYLSAIDEERASAVVAVDIEHTGTAGPRTLYDIYFRLTFVRVGDAWKVDQVTDLNFGSGPATPGTDVTTDTTATTATSVP